ncbi:hypothetical protein BKA63DRAFT_494376 [Paraphoma chrysanthemicola]|nr:hypothetical protein BKA63DRAFT_494376 [Paraphoma chrysanthemicola]
MAVKDNFMVPASAQELPVGLAPGTAFFILFLASIDPATKQPWCSDVRATLPLLNKIFAAASSPEIRYAYVGSKAEYKDPVNRFRTQWNINNIPTLSRYQRSDNGKIEEVGRLVETELQDESRVQDLISS